MGYVVKEYKKPTDVYIIGTDFQGEKQAFGITDDYSEIEISNGVDKVRLYTDGWVFIYTLEELTEHQDKVWWESDIFDCDLGAIVLKDFVGELKLVVLNETGEDLLTSFDPTEYLLHQECFYDLNDDVEYDTFLTVPTDTPLPKDAMELKDLYESLGFNTSKGEI